jgi:hypothetical protein
VGGPNAERLRALDLRAYLGFDLAHVGARGGYGLGRVQVALGVEQSRHAILRQDRPPAKELPLARQGQVQSKIGLGVGSRISGDLREPRAGDHDAAGIDQPALERFDRRGVHRVGHAQVIDVDYEQLGVRGMAEPFGQSL